MFWFGLVSLALSAVTAGQSSWHEVELAPSGWSLRSVILVALSIVSLAVAIILRATERSTPAPVVALGHGHGAPAQSGSGDVSAYEHRRPPLQHVVSVLAIMTAIAAMVVLLILGGVGSGN